MRAFAQGRAFLTHGELTLFPVLRPAYADAFGDVGGLRTHLGAVVSHQGRPVLMASATEPLVPAGRAARERQLVDATLAELDKTIDTDAPTLDAVTALRVEADRAALLAQRLDGQIASALQELAWQRFLELLASKSKTLARDLGNVLHREMAHRLPAIVAQLSPKAFVRTEVTLAKLADEVAAAAPKTVDLDRMRQVAGEPVARALLRHPDELRSIGFTASQPTEKTLATFLSEKFGWQPGTTVGGLRSDAIIADPSTRRLVNVDYTASTRADTFESVYRQVRDDLGPGGFDGNWQQLPGAYQRAGKKLPPGLEKRVEDLTTHAVRETVVRRVLLEDLFGAPWQITSHELTYDGLRLLLARLRKGADISDRLVYSNYFVPVRVVASDRRTPLLPFYRKQQILEVAENDVLHLDQLRDILDDLGYGEAWQLNDMDDAAAQLAQTRPPIEGATPFRQEVTRATVLTNQQTEFISGMLRPDVGVVFLDRTRVTPVGFALGEHLYAQGLAPGEEAVLEQKTFTKRQVTLEEQSEQEKQFDLELASTYSTELQEGLESQRSRSDTSGLNASHTGQYSSPANLPWGQITASHTVGATSSVATADQQTSRESVKDNQTASGKVSARYRAQHKTTFRVATEQGFEAVARRTIRNPNRTTPVTLHCFKVMQRLEMKQERYGVRLCWAAHVKDPAGTFFTKIAAAKDAIVAAADAGLPAQPVEPAAPPEPESTTTTSRVTRVIDSPVIDANKWGLWGDQRAEYDADLEVPQGWSWDGDVNNVSITLDSLRPHSTISRWIVGKPYPVEGNKLRARVHIGAPVWIGGPRINFQVHATIYQDVTISDKAAADTKYFDDLALYRTALKEWNDQRDAVLAAARLAADAKQAEMLATLSPINEMTGQIIEQHFPAAVRDEMTEIDYWQGIFDWERATFVAYPGWWSGRQRR